MKEVAAREGYGSLFTAFGTVADGLAACDAVDSLVDASAIDTLLSNFIVPLQSDDISRPDASGALAGGDVLRGWMGGSQGRQAVPQSQPRRCSATPTPGPSAARSPCA